VPISVDRATKALNILIRKGLISTDQIPGYRSMVKSGLSYKGLMLAELGKIIGTYYIAEEEAQHDVLHSMKLNLAHMSVPEVLLLEDTFVLEPWHQEAYSIISGTDKFQQEAAEPWHVSLREKYRPDKTVLKWFKTHPEYIPRIPQILKKAYALEGS